MSWWKNKEGGNQVIKGIIKEFGLCPEGRRELAEEFEPGSHMVIFSEQIVGRKEAERSPGSGRGGQSQSSDSGGRYR